MVKTALVLTPDSNLWKEISRILEDAQEMVRLNEICWLQAGWVQEASTILYGSLKDKQCDLLILYPQLGFPSMDTIMFEEFLSMVVSRAPVAVITLNYTNEEFWKRIDDISERVVLIDAVEQLPGVVENLLTVSV